ncbi:MAG: LON peptidase substrate-binding domain-containing protein [Betaproteobacteria bacterium]
MPQALTLESLPLFPLGTVLYPGGVLPLRIFEVRYLDMIGKCHKVGAPFGVVALTRGSEVRRAPNSEPTAEAFPDETFHDIGTLATITALSRPQAGLMEIRCVGLQRFTLRRREKLRHGLWVGDVEQLPDDLPTPVPPDLLPIAQSLGRLVERLQQQGMSEAQLPMDLPLRLDDCGWVANRWCELLGLAPELQQRMMVLDNPLVRLELVGDILQRHGIEL